MRSAEEIVEELRTRLVKSKQDPKKARGWYMSRYIECLQDILNWIESTDTERESGEKE
jgi:hypothetical protein